MPILPTVSPWQKVFPCGGMVVMEEGSEGGTEDAGLSHAVSLQSFQGSHGRAYLFNSV